MEVNPAIQPRGLPEDEVIFSPLPSAKKSALFSETGAVAATPDISFPDTNNGPREKRRDSSRSVAGFSETGAVVPEPDTVRFSVANQESRQGRGVETSAKLFRPAAKSSTFSETASVVPQPDQERGQEDRQGRVISSSQLFRPVPAKTSSFSETIPLVPGPMFRFRYTESLEIARISGMGESSQAHSCSVLWLPKPAGAPSGVAAASGAI